MGFRLGLLDFGVEIVTYRKDHTSTLYPNYSIVGRVVGVKSRFSVL